MASGDIAVNFDDIKSKPCNTTEVHAKSECKYKRRKLTKDGNTIYMWYRICVCKKYMQTGVRNTRNTRIELLILKMEYMSTRKAAFIKSTPFAKSPG